jgi:ketosteroid isomerase-like protein
VVAEWKGDATLVNGVRYHNRYCMVLTLRDGKIRHFDEYCCTIHADEALGPFLPEV